MTRVFLDDDADLGLVQDRNVAVLGYDDQAGAQALCLRDSGVDVRVGLPAGSGLWDEAVADGLRVVTPYEACEEADLVVVPVLAASDRVVPDVVLPNLVPGDAVVLGESAVFGADAPDGVDVVRVVPWADGAAVREEYSRGRGAPMFASVVVDGSGRAWDLALAYARAVGGTRAGVVRTGDDEYTAARAFAGGTLLRDGVLPQVRRGFDRLVASGCQPALAYLLAVHGLEVFAAEVAAGEYDAALRAARTGAGRDPGAADEAGERDDPLPAAAALVRSLTGQERPSRRGLD